MHDEIAEPPLRVRDFEARTVDLDDAVVADLAASLRVERGRIQDDFDLVAFPCRGDLLAGAHDSDELRFLLRSLVAGEEAGAGLGEDARQRLAIRQVQLRAPVAAGTRTLLVHQYLEVGAVDLEARVLRDLERQLEREPVRVVQLERDIARHLRRARIAGGSDLGVEERHAEAQRLMEPVLLAGDDLLDVRACGRKVRVRLSHHLSRGGDHVGRDQLLDSELVRLAHGPAHDAADHVAAVFV